MSDIEQRVKKIVAEQLGVAEADIKIESSFVDDLGADSRVGGRAGAGRDDDVGEAAREQVVDADVYSQLLRSGDAGVEEFLDLAHVKPNTLGNTRMIKHLN